MLGIGSILGGSTAPAMSPVPGKARAAPEVILPASRSIEYLDVAKGSGGYEVVVWTRAKRRSLSPGRAYGRARDPQTGEFGPPVRISDRPAFAPRVSITPSGETFVTWTTIGGVPQFAYRTPQAGWSGPRDLPGSRVSSRPKLAIAASSIAVAAWLEERADGGERLMASVRPPGGEFGVAQVLSGDAQGGSLFEVDAGASGDLAVILSPACDANTVVFRMPSGAGEFGVASQIPNSRCPTYDVDIAVDGDGGAVALIGGIGDLPRVKASDAASGESFAPASLISRVKAACARVESSAAGQTVASWCLLKRARNTPRGIAVRTKRPETPFGGQRRISDRHGGGYQAMAMNDSGHTVIAWRSGKTFSLQASTSAPGRGFSRPVRVSPRLRADSLGDFAAAIGPRGRALVAWTRPRKDGTQGGIYVSRLNAG